MAVPGEDRGAQGAVRPDVLVAVKPVTAVEEHLVLADRPVAGEVAVPGEEDLGDSRARTIHVGSEPDEPGRPVQDIGPVLRASAHQPIVDRLAVLEVGVTVPGDVLLGEYVPIGEEGARSESVVCGSSFSLIHFDQVRACELTTAVMVSAPIPALARSWLIKSKRQLSKSSGGNAA